MWTLFCWRIALGIEMKPNLKKSLVIKLDVSLVLRSTRPPACQHRIDDKPDANQQEANRARKDV